MRFSVIQIPYRSFSKSIKNQSNPVRLAYNSVVPKDGVASDQSPLLIFHGLFGSKNNWKSISSQLAQRTKRQIYAFDLRNHGQSPHTSGEEATLQCMAGDIEYFMKEKNLQKASLLGHR